MEGSFAMISVNEALGLVREHSRSLPAERVKLEHACGLRLAEAVVSQVDSPPFCKSIVDGYAVSTGDDSPTLRVIEQVTAGMVPHHAVQPGTTIRVMTGAPVPEGADAVVKIEDVEHTDEETIRLPAEAVEPHGCVSPKGSSFRTGQILLEQGSRLRPIDIALLAEIGEEKVSVIPRPRVAVLPTGNELVDVGGALAKGQIRNSNGPMLLAALREQGIETVDLGIGRDDVEDLRTRIQLGLDADVLLVSGGVSAGVLDLVPGVLEELGVEQVFHKVKVKPGKPLWFGVGEMGQARTLVFGLPGNPVSSMVSYRLFVQPALTALAGDTFEIPRAVRGVLADTLAHSGKRPTYHPCKINFGSRHEGLPEVMPIPWQGSSDLAALTRANALVVLQPGKYQLEARTEVDVLTL